MRAALCSRGVVSCIASRCVALRCVALRCIALAAGSGLYYIGFLLVAIYNTAPDLAPDAPELQGVKPEALALSARFGFLEIYLPFVFCVIVCFMIITFRFAQDTPTTKKIEW